jgi:hypothetical protein
MAKCSLGEKKLNLYRAVGQKQYACGFVRGGWEHFTAECWYIEEDGSNSADMVNLTRQEVTPYVRSGKLVDENSLIGKALNAIIANDATR